MRELFRRFFAPRTTGPLTGGPFQPATIPDGGLSLPQHFCWYLARRSRSVRVLECSLGQSTGFSVWNCDWPVEASTGCPAPDARPTLTHRRQECDANRVFSILRDEPVESSVVCITGLETLRDPTRAIPVLRQLTRTARYLMLCTEAGESDKEQAETGFAALCRQLGIPPAFTGVFKKNGQSGHCALSGRETTVSIPSRQAKSLALMFTYNEEDVIEQTVASLFAQGLDVFVTDEGSTDSTVERLESIAKSSGRLILDKDSRKNATHFDKEAQLTRILESAGQAAAMGFEWMMYVDADEIRCSPWPDVTLAEAFAHVEQMGYNAVDFTVIDFRYAKGQQMTHEPYEQQMTHFEFGLRPGHFLQIKAWRHKPDTQASLYPSRGHEVVFEGRRVFPLKFLLKHYPLRGLEMARKKIYQNRFPRYAPKELANGAHVQYNTFRDHEPEGWYVAGLPLWDDHFHSRYLLERLGGIGLKL
jgi:hypothetical protein